MSDGGRSYESALVLGLGESGEAAAGLLLGEGTTVTVVDGGGNAELNERAEKLRREGAQVWLGTSALPRGKDGSRDSFDVGVVSPGFRTDSAWVLEAETRCGSVISELELGASRCVCDPTAVSRCG